MASLLNLGMAPAAIEAALNNLVLPRVVRSAILDIQNLYLQFDNEQRYAALDSLLRLVGQTYVERGDILGLVNILIGQVGIANYGETRRIFAVFTTILGRPRVASLIYENVNLMQEVINMLNADVDDFTGEVIAMGNAIVDKFDNDPLMLMTALSIAHPQWYKWQNTHGN